jgi:hypothetical protein
MSAAIEPDPGAARSGAARHPVPLDVVLALPTSSCIRKLIQDRRDHGDRPCPTAFLYALGKQYFALVDFYGPGRPGLVIPLDVWVWNGPGGGGAA